jgi:hypothetical protein
MYIGEGKTEFSSGEIDRRQDENPYQASIEVIQDSTPRVRIRNIPGFTISHDPSLTGSS